MAINVLSTAEVNVMMKQWLARGVPVSSQHVLDAELERDKESKSNLQLNRRLQDAINSAACEDLFKQENGVNEDAGEEEEESGDLNDEDDEEEVYDSVNDNLF